MSLHTGKALGGTCCQPPPRLKRQGCGQDLGPPETPPTSAPDGNWVAGKEKAVVTSADSTPGEITQERWGERKWDR